MWSIYQMNTCRFPFFGAIAFALLASCSNTGVEVTQQVVSPAMIPQDLNLRLDRNSTFISASEQQLSVYLTGYSYWDNTPPGSASIARPVIHRQAGGAGTFQDPITLAVGHSIIGRSQTLDFPAGTRFYFPQLQRYAIVEDVCGDGPQPQNGPCHSGRNGMPWVDIYVGGHASGNSAAQACMFSITGIHDAIINPRNGYPVNAGPLAESGCRT